MSKLTSLKILKPIIENLIYATGSLNNDEIIESIMNNISVLLEVQKTQLVKRMEELRRKTLSDSELKKLKGFFGFSQKNAEKFAEHILSVGYNQALDDVSAIKQPTTEEKNV